MQKITLTLWLIRSSFVFGSPENGAVVVIQFAKNVCNSVVVPYCQRNDISWQAGVVRSMRNVALPGKIEGRALVSNSVLQGVILFGYAEKLQQFFPKHLHSSMLASSKIYLDHLVWNAPLSIATKKDAAIHHVLVPILHGAVSYSRGRCSSAKDIAEKNSIVDEWCVLLKDSSQLALVAGVIQFVPSFVQSGFSYEDFVKYSSGDARLFSFNVARQVLNSFLDVVVNRVEYPQIFNNAKIRWLCCITGSFLISYFLECVGSQLI